MKRRSFIRAAMSLASAGVFTATGWLMGTRVLTMPPDPPPGCDTFCAAGGYCKPAYCPQNPDHPCDCHDVYFYDLGPCSPPYPCEWDFVRCFCACTFWPCDS
jgi:hypothetical protein